jgi:hypothetical protein
VEQMRLGQNVPRGTFCVSLTQSVGCGKIKFCECAVESGFGLREELFDRKYPVLGSGGCLLPWFEELDDPVLGVGDGDFGVKVPGWEHFFGDGYLGGADEEG